MERRFFPIETVDHNGVLAPGQIIRCATCGARDHVTQAHGRRMLPPEATANKFRLRGWTVGKTERKDRCPECSGAAKKKEIEEVGMQKDSPVVELRPPVAGASDKAPREMTREDRRIIFAKLEEVYLNEATGYIAGWNDHAVAADLNCPRAWVATIRDENFGPQKAEQSAEVINLTRRIEDAELGGQGLAEEAARIRKQAEEARIAAAAIEGRSRDLLKGLETLRADLKKMIGGR